jgi:hypothetical protein
MVALPSVLLVTVALYGPLSFSPLSAFLIELMETAEDFFVPADALTGAVAVVLRTVAMARPHHTA